ncbi:MAG: hypothetical protein JWP45_828 [Mucilaginibacter sp.]|nr:hypothetical protein [Mucilaginibacter sp.]
MLSEKLKETTKVNHQSLEKKIVARMRSIGDINDYAILVGIFYSFFGGLELQILKHLDQTLLPDYASRRKTGMLGDDLINLTGVLRSLATAEDLPAIHNHLQAMGALYVIEGSTLGGQIIRKMIAKQLNTGNPAGMSFFDGYKDETAVMWERFKQNLDGPYYYNQEESIIESANNTFIKLNHWFDITY